MLTFSYYAVHSPHEGRQDLVEYFKAKGLKGKLADYAAMVKATDESVGRVLQSIEKKGITEETVVIFLSDQGGYFDNAPFTGGKMSQTLYEGGARVPFFVKWPGVVKANSLNQSIVQSTDIYPTLIDLAGGQLASDYPIDGVSLLPTLKNGSMLEREPIFGYRAYEDLYASVRDGDWKLLAYRSGLLKLYNIKTDVEEHYDVSKSHPEHLRKMVQQLKQWEQELDMTTYSGLQ